MERPTPLLPITSTGSPMMVEDLHQLLLPEPLPRRDKDIFHTTMLNLQSLPTTRETMPGPITKLTRLMRLNGKLTSQLWVLIILTLLKTHWNFQLLVFRERDKCIQSRIAHPTSHHTLKETTLGMMPNTTNPTRLPGVRKPTLLLLTISTGSLMMEVDLPQQLLLVLLLRRNKGLFHSMISNLLSLLMNKEMMHGLTIKLISQMKLSGKLTFLL